MGKKTFTITYTGLMTALTVAALYLSAAAANLRLSFAAIASLFAASALIEAGWGAAVFVYAGAGLLSGLLLPSKDGVLLYLLFFGYYPIVKSLVERLPKALSWAVKLLVFNGAFTVLRLFFQGLFAPGLMAISPVPLYRLMSAAFCVFDLGYSKLLHFYAQRISKYLRKNQR